jgi:hypothetical protein
MFLEGNVGISFHLICYLIFYGASDREIITMKHDLSCYKI